MLPFPYWRKCDLKDLIKVRNFCSQNVRQGFSEFTKCMSNGHFQPVYYSFIRILPPLDWPSTLIFPPGTGHQLTVPIGKADPAPPRVMSADLREVNGALTPAGRFAATPTPPPGEQQGRSWGLPDVGRSQPGRFLHRVSPAHSLPCTRIFSCDPGQ